MGWFINFEERNLKLGLEKNKQILKLDIILIQLVNNSIKNILCAVETEDMLLLIKLFFSLCLVLSRHKLKLQKRILQCIAVKYCLKNCKVSVDGFHFVYSCFCFWLETTYCSFLFLDWNKCFMLGFCLKIVHNSSFIIVHTQTCFTWESNF